MEKLFITFEGIEGCGKSTQAKLLAEYLQNNNHQVVLTREPGGTNISEQIRSIILDPKNTEMTPETELLLYLAARNQHTAQKIIPALNNKQIVISDRYYDSTFAYQGVARKINYDKIIYMNSFATYNLIPDITFIMDIPVYESIKRIMHKKLDRLEQEPEEFHKNVRDAFLKLASKEKRFIILNGMQSIDTIHQEIIDIIYSQFIK
ncbi:MAG: dTMP kinase [Candidatus Cloacimonetes bacterium]|nr:dTMP kinase [Candidatus Cloacimonadota bacterium]